MDGGEGGKWAVVIQYVQHLSELRVQQCFRSVVSQPLQQPIKHLHLVDGV
jgi:hypothetical protein